MASQSVVSSTSTLSCLKSCIVFPYSTKVKCLSYRYKSVWKAECVLTLHRSCHSISVGREKLLGASFAFCISINSRPPVDPVFCKWRQFFPIRVSLSCSISTVSPASVVSPPSVLIPCPLAWSVASFLPPQTMWPWCNFQTVANGEAKGSILSLNNTGTMWSVLAG